MVKRRITAAKLNEYGDRMEELLQQTQVLIDKLNGHVDQHKIWAEEWAARQEETEKYVKVKRSEIDGHLGEVRERSDSALRGIDEQVALARSRLNNIHTSESSSRDSLSEILVAAKAAEEKHRASVAMRESIAEDKETLYELIETAKELSKRVERLLPGATSAGLALAYKERKGVFLWPKRIWAWVLAGTLAVMFAAVFSTHLVPKLRKTHLGESLCICSVGLHLPFPSCG